MSAEIVPLVAIICLFVVLPAIVLRHIAETKKARSLTTQDEKLLDELHDLSRRLEDRLITIERILDAENPGWRRGR
jgi:phage shock protein B